MCDGIARNSVLASAWTERFLNHRKLDHPDGRALYAYRCSHEEFVSLAKLLTHCPPSTRTNDDPIRAFVLYSSEWWQRKYDGGTWAWEPLLASIGWQTTHYPDLYEPVKAAWIWWKVDLVRLPTSIRYLGTFACQGGLPLALLNDTHSSITRYLRAVLKHITDFRQFVDDPIVLARDQQHLLRPPTLRRDYVFRLSADLAEAVLECQHDAQGDDLIRSLNEMRPDWERTMPLALDDQRAQDLLTSLLREAVRSQTEPVANFRVERFLRQTGEGWRLGARIRLPTTISPDALARQLGVPTNNFPARFQVHTCGDSPQTIGLYAQEGDKFLLARGTQSLMELWDQDAAREIRIRFFAGGVIGKPVIPNRGGALSELPWSFLGTDDFRLIGEGSISSRVTEIRILIPDGCTLQQRDGVHRVEETRCDTSLDTTPQPTQILGRTLWRACQEAVIETASGRCVVRPSSEHTTDKEYKLLGSRFYELECPWPLFRGEPRLYLERSEQPPRPVPTHEIEWRQGIGDWLFAPTGPGLWEIRNLKSGELRFLGKAGVLPEQLEFSIRPGVDMTQGHFILKNTNNMRVVGDDPDSVVSSELENKNNVIRVEVKSIAINTPPTRVRLRFHWSGAQELNLEAPFPGQGGRFLREGNAVTDHLAADDLYGVRATALSPIGTQEYWIEGHLQASDVRPIFHIAYFRKKLRKAGVMHELPISEARQMIDLLLSASSSTDAHVVLEIMNRSGIVQESIRVSRFSAILDCHTEQKTVSVSPVLESQDVIPTFEAYSLTRPDDVPITLEPAGPVYTPYGALLPPSLEYTGPCIIVMRHSNQVRAQPCRVEVGHVSDNFTYLASTNDKVPLLVKALAIEDEIRRIDSIGDTLDKILEEDTESNEAEWAFLTDSILGLGSLPPSILDLFRILVSKPKFLVRCLFNLESTPRQYIWSLEQELPFSWLLIKRQIWWDEACRTFDIFRQRLKGVVDNPAEMAREHVLSILSEGADRLAGFQTIVTDVDLRLEGANMSMELVEASTEERNNQIPEQISLRTNLDDWPKGYGRKEWKDELGTFPEVLCQLKDEHPARQPIFDTPIAAAWCCFKENPTERTIFLVKQIRAHAPDWFDLAYSTTWYALAYIQDNQIRKT